MKRVKLSNKNGDWEVSYNGRPLEGVIHANLDVVAGGIPLLMLTFWNPEVDIEGDMEVEFSTEEPYKVSDGGKG